jgi:hypothetical protein
MIFRDSRFIYRGSHKEMSISQNLFKKGLALKMEPIYKWFLLVLGFFPTGDL